MQKTLIELMREIFAQGRVMVLKDSPRRWNAAQELKEAGLIECKPVEGFTDAVIVSQFIPAAKVAEIKGEALPVASTEESPQDTNSIPAGFDEPAPL